MRALLKQRDLKWNCTDPDFWPSYSISEQSLFVSDFSKFLSINSFSVTSPPLLAGDSEGTGHTQICKMNECTWSVDFFSQNCGAVRMLKLTASFPMYSQYGSEMGTQSCMCTSTCVPMFLILTRLLGSLQSVFKVKYSYDNRSFLVI